MRRFKNLVGTAMFVPLLLASCGGSSGGVASKPQSPHPNVMQLDTIEGGPLLFLNDCTITREPVATENGMVYKIHGDGQFKLSSRDMWGSSPEGHSLQVQMVVANGTDLSGPLNPQARTRQFSSIRSGDYWSLDSYIPAESIDGPPSKLLICGFDSLETPDPYVSPPS